VTSEAGIIVVGAGPAGLAAALRLQQAGYAVSLIAPAATAPDRRTSALIGGSVGLLERIGVWAAIEPQAAPLRTLRIVDGTRRLIRSPEVTFNASEIGLDAFGYNVPNSALIQALQAAVAATGVERVANHVDGVTAGDNEVAVNLADRSTRTAKLVIASDGRNSRVRESLGIAVSEWRYRQAALVVNLRHADPHHDTSTEFHTEAGPFTLVPLPGKRSSLVWVGRPGDIERRAALSEEALAVEIEAQSSSILGAVEIDGPRQVFPLAGMRAARLAADRVALVGEAAHLFPPIGAQGLNLGYRDVAALGDVLAGRPPDPGESRRLAAYERARRADVFTRTAAVDALNRTLLTGFLPVQGVRGLGLFLLDRIAPLRRAVMRQGVVA
jgi:2-octaprenyl-6-methoxyphenol hydroxylase